MLPSWYKTDFRSFIVTSLQYHLSPSISNSSSNKDTPPTHLPVSISAPNTNALWTALSAARQVLSPLHCALPPPYRHGSPPKDYHLVPQIPIHPLLTSHTFCYLLELVLHHSSIPLPTFPFQSASMLSQNPPRSSVPYYFSVIWHFVINYYS